MNGFFGMTLLLAAVAGGLAQLLLLGVRRGWETMTGLDRLRRSLSPLQDLWTAENEIFLETRRKVEDAQKRLTTAEQRLKQIQRDIEKVERTPPCFLHTLGQPGPSLRPFRAELMFDGSMSRAAGRPVSPVWYRNNRLVVHATDMEAARREADRVFPEKGGFVKMFGGTASR